MFQTGRSDSHKLSLSEPSELQIEHLTEPNLVALIKDSQFGGVVVKFEELDDLHLKIEFVEFAFIVATSLYGDVMQLCDILV